MELRHLRYFVTVADVLNFTHAAAKLHVAQPALSSQIKDLENELETRLFERKRTGVRLTAAGEAFYPRAKHILSEASLAASEARTAAGLIAGRLSIGFPSGIHLNYLLPAIKKMKKMHSKTHFEFIHALPGPELKALRDGAMDLAFVTLPALLQGLEHSVIWRVPLYVALPADHELACRPSFELSQLRAQQFVFCTRESRPEFYDEFFRQCANAGFRPRVVQEVGGYPTSMLGLISVGVGLSVLPYFTQVEKFRGLVWRPLHKPRLWSEFALVWRPDPSPVLRQFLGICRREFPMEAIPRRAEL